MEKVLKAAVFIVSWAVPLGFILAGAVYGLERTVPGLVPPLILQVLSMTALALLLLPIFIGAHEGRPREKWRAAHLVYLAILMIAAFLRR